MRTAIEAFLAMGIVVYSLASLMGCGKKDVSVRIYNSLGRDVEAFVMFSDRDGSPSKRLGFFTFYDKESQVFSCGESVEIKLVAKE